jgi:hypothetical protein
MIIAEGFLTGLGNIHRNAFVIGYDQGSLGSVNPGAFPVLD